MQRVFAFNGPTLSRAHLIRQFIRALAVMLIALSFVVEAGAAKPRPYSIGNASQNGFVAACRENGGTTRRLSTRVVECTLPNGYVIVCNFNSGLCIDYPPSGVISVDDSGTNGSRTLISTGTGELLAGLSPSPSIHLAS